MDSLYGGTGNDTYDVDSSGDVVHESVGEGIDSVFAAADYTLAANVENLTLKTGVAWDAYGNALANVLIGNGVGNQLFGFDGNDTLIGGGGADSLYGGAGSDRFVFDQLDSSVDHIRDFSAGAGGDVIDVRDVLVGFVPGTSTASNFLRLAQAGDSTIVSLNADGVGSDFSDFALLRGVTGLVLDGLVANANLLLA